MDVSDTAWEPPESFEEYRLIRPLGAGAMGEVQLAHDTLLDRLVAVKFLSGLAPDEGQRERFRTEARAVARLQHPNIVAVYRTGEVRRRPYLVSEYIRGSSLDKLPWPAPAETVLGIGIGLARGLAAAHRRGVLHRDIKPANAMLTEEGEVKLLDFGLAKLLDAVEEPRQSPPPPGARVDAVDDLDATLSTPGPPVTGSPSAGSGDVAGLTVPGSLVGTPRYMAPESWRGELASTRSDVYSLGSVLYELCTGHAPHTAQGLGALKQAVLGRRAPPVAQHAPGLDARLAAIIDRCLEPEPEHRFASAEPLREALEALRDSKPGEAAGSSRPYPGLHAFSAEERGVFFGRGTEVRALLDRLRAEPFVLVAGDSGVGKSSLCRAGLLPRIAEGALGGAWTDVALVPGRHPLAALATALASLPGVDEKVVVEAVRAGPRELGRLLRGSNARGVFLFVDQLEELLTLAPPEEATLVAEALGALAEGVPGVRLLATARGDFLTRLATLRGLGDGLSGALYLLRPLSEEGLREAIVAPAQARGVAFESETLVDALVAAGRAEGSLPLLQFALAELWEARDAARHLIPAVALEALGGVSGALARHADGVLARLLPVQQAAARRLLLRLVTAEGTRARRTRAELWGAGADTGEERVALEALVRGRLVVAREAQGEATYEVAHEALLSGWEQLRGWLAGDAERRAAHQRLERAAAEWQRLGQPGEALWGARWLREVESLHPGELASREATFLAASRRAVRRARMLRLGTLLALPLTLALLYGGNLLLLRLETRREVDRHMETARHLLDGARARDATVEALRREAFAAFDARKTQEAEALWARALALATEVYEQGHDLARQELEQALLRDPDRHDTRALLAHVLYERLLLAERDNQVSLRRDLLRQLDLHDATGEYHRRLHEPARLELETLPPGVPVSMQRYGDEGGYRRPSALRALESSPQGHVELAPGSYRLVFSPRDRPPVVLPVLLSPGEHLRLRIPLPAHVPEGYVYVPPGRFLSGSNDDELARRDLLGAQPLHAFHTGGYLIARYEVTYSEWLRFLRVLPPAERASRQPRASDFGGGVELTEQPGGTWRLALRRTPTLSYEALEGERLHYQDRAHHASPDWLRLPVTGISWEDGRAYAAWLADSGQVPGARLCELHEWERAARGADARLYPQGDRLEPDDANFDRTYGRQTFAFGPDEVGSHPASDSPFGLSDLTGNVWEWVGSSVEPGSAFYAGGSFYQDSLSARSNNHATSEPSHRSPLIGLRLCADPPVPDPDLP